MVKDLILTSTLKLILATDKALIFLGALALARQVVQDTTYIIIIFSLVFALLFFVNVLTTIVLFIRLYNNPFFAYKGNDLDRRLFLMEHANEKLEERITRYQEVFQDFVDEEPEEIFKTSQLARYWPLVVEIDRYLNLEDVRTLCFALDIKYENLPGEGKLAKIREMVKEASRTAKINRMVAVLTQERPNVKWRDKVYGT